MPPTPQVQPNAATWTKARVSIGAGACVEIRGDEQRALAMRDSKNIDGAAIVSHDVTLLVEAAKRGAVDVWRFRGVV